MTDERTVSVALVDARDSILDMLVTNLALLDRITPEWQHVDGARVARMSLDDARKVYEHGRLVQVTVLINTNQSKTCSA